MNIPELKWPAARRHQATPRDTHFQWNVRVREPDETRTRLDNSRNPSGVAREWSTIAAFEYVSDRDTEDELQSTRYQAELLLWNIDGMDGLREGWRVAVEEPGGWTEWTIRSIEWWFGNGRLPLLKVRRTDQPLVGG